MRASKLKGQRGPQKKSQPLDPVELSRRLNIVIAERQLENLQLTRKLKASETSLPSAQGTHDVHTHDVHSKKTAPHSQDNKRSSLLSGPRTSSTRWVFRTKPAAGYSSHHSSDSGATYVHVPREPNAASARNFRGCGGRQDHEGAQQADKYCVVLNQSSSEPARGPTGDSKELCPPDWTHGGSGETKLRRLQLLKRPIAVLKLRLGGDGPEPEQVSKVDRTRCDTTMSGGHVVVNRKSGVFSKLLAH
ncbi:hypothetical protein DHEL01_v203797 [Diaporthe helianthi]|uniref:Uncharacterized protein n=1 Tax=Diaporthe helianthi TaxID=158607 RepID=A0A2P5I5M9_DIAHE|nr:hypothetical protein DHEL01_v203797 [Diaporthe helianthi]